MIVPGQYYIEEILLKIPNQACLINIFQNSDVEILGIPWLLKPPQFDRDVSSEGRKTFCKKN